MNRNVKILIADDDPDDKILLKEAFNENFDSILLDFVENGEELLEYLDEAHDPEQKKSLAMPDLILLDLNMPKKDGREALKDIKTHPFYHSIPVIVFSTSKSETDLQNSYRLGANSFITKPVTYLELLEVTRAIGNYWFEIVLLSAPLSLKQDGIKAS